MILYFNSILYFKIIEKNHKFTIIIIVIINIYNVLQLIYSIIIIIIHANVYTFIIPITNTQIIFLPFVCVCV